VFTPHQFKRSDAAMFYGLSQWTLPDITIWSAPGEHHEIKHKKATPRHEYGLERYRLEALTRFAAITEQRVLYTIHDWENANPLAQNSREPAPNNLADWFTADVMEFADGCWARAGQSYYGGQLRDGMEICYWYADRFVPLSEFWGIHPKPSSDLYVVTHEEPHHD
jgi:hypothetical protein